MPKSENLDTIILASGEDHRLTSITEALGEVDTPKQFALIAGDGSLLQQTVARHASHFCLRLPPVPDIGKSHVDSLRQKTTRPQKLRRTPKVRNSAPVARRRRDEGGAFPIVGIGASADITAAKTLEATLRNTQAGQEVSV
ncbi:MAG: hypothetical protein WBP56_07725 [Polyangia bacterium]|jgi:hypothetical protein